MEHVESEFIGIKDLKIYYQAWLPESPKAVVQIAHGGFEHSGRYLNVVNELVPRGYAIYANDHRGHGKSDGEINYVDTFDQYIEDQKLLYNNIKERYPNLPIFMLGHSMGSLIAMYFTKKYENFLAGLILSGTGISTGGEVSGLLKFMAKLFSKIAPHMKIDPKLDAKFLSHDPKVVIAYEQDPLVHAKKITAKLGYEMLKFFKDIPTIIDNFKLPLLIQCGSEDKLLAGAEVLKDMFTMEDKTIKIYDGLYHEVYNEVEEDRKKVLKDLSDWLEKHVE
ncbi:MAG: lysophospholipase [Candidatus Lokiarchaeota archaeon]|nr:lysophospholipase [Candidatus Lokiarchaeota archaeon]